MALGKAHLTGSINSDNIETVISKDGVFSGTESMLTTVDEQSWLCAQPMMKTCAWESLSPLAWFKNWQRKKIIRTLIRKTHN